MDHTMMARVMALVAELEALKTEVEVLKREWPDGGGEHLFQEKADQMRGVESELNVLSY